jgi:hypothetical protein
LSSRIVLDIGIFDVDIATRGMSNSALAADIAAATRYK